MKILIAFAIVLTAFATTVLHSQVFSDITYSTGTSIDVGSGADVCATNVIINGTFSGGGTICSGALPVSLSAFTSSVNKRDVTLMWVTEWELNNSGFEIERSLTQIGAEGWQKITFIPGQGTSSVPKGYKFNDEKLKAGTYHYRLKQIDFNGNYEYFSLESQVIINPPMNFEMSQNYPNPSNPRSKINFEIPVNGMVTIKVYDITGREVITLLDETREADYYTIDFDGTDLASGVYFYRIISEDEGKSFCKTLKMILVK